MKSLLWRQIWNLSDKIQKTGFIPTMWLLPLRAGFNTSGVHKHNIIQISIVQLICKNPWQIPALTRDVWENRSILSGTERRKEEFRLEPQINDALTLFHLIIIDQDLFAPVFICDCIFICIFAFAIESQINDGLHFSTRLPSHHHRPRFNVYVFVLSVFLYFVSVFALAFLKRISISHQATLCIKLTSTLVNLMFLCTQVNPGPSWPTDAHRNSPINENPEIAFNLIQLQAKLRVMSWSVFELDCPPLMSWHHRAGLSVYIVNQSKN